MPILSADPYPEGDFLFFVTEAATRLKDLLMRTPAATIGLLATDKRAPLALGKRAWNFACGAVTDALTRKEGINRFWPTGRRMKAYPQRRRPVLPLSPLPMPMLVRFKDLSQTQNKP